MKKTIDFVKTVMIYLLTASMLTFAGLYINERQNAGKEEGIPADKMRILESMMGTAPLAGTDKNHIRPLQVTVTTDGNSYAAIYNDNAVADIYGHFTEAAAKIFGGGSECVRLEESEGDKLWRECAEKKNSAYIRYAGDYLYPLIYAFLENVWEAEAFSGDLAMVNEFFIADFDPIYGIARDKSGKISAFIPDKETTELLKELLSYESLRAAYENIGAVPGEFAGGGPISEKTGINKNDIKNLIFPYTFYLSHNYSAYSPVLNFSNPLFDESGSLDAGKAFIRELFKELNFNFESSNSYSARNGIMLRDGKNTVYLYDDGKITYASDETADSGGVHLSKFLGYDAAHYTYYEKIKAASIFAGKLSRELTGNESALILKSTEADKDENLLVVFSYYYEGIQIKINGTSEALILKINKNSIGRAAVNALGVSSVTDTLKDKNPIFELSVIDSVISREITAGVLEKEEIAEKYNLTYDKNFDKFIINAFEPVYRINYAQTGEPAKASREIS